MIAKTPIECPYVYARLEGSNKIVFRSNQKGFSPNQFNGPQLLPLPLLLQKKTDVATCFKCASQKESDRTVGLCSALS